MSRIGYAILLIFGLIIQMISMSSKVADWIVKIGLYKCVDDIPPKTELAGDNGVIDTITNVVNEGIDTISNTFSTEATPQCRYRASYFVIYRIAYAYVAFFGLLALIMIKVKNSNDFRAQIQNGYWGIKFIIVIALAIACFFIPDGGFNDFMYVVGLIAGFFFILWQLIILVDFAHNWNEKMLENISNSEDSRGWKILLMVCAFGQYLAALIVVILLFVYFGSSGCGLNQFFISIALILSVVCGVVSIHSKIQEENESSGLLQAAIVSIYICYLTFSAMSSEHSKDYSTCNPMQAYSNTTSGGTSGLQLMNGSSVFGTILFILVVLYSTISNVGASDDATGSGSSNIAMLETGKDGENPQNTVVDDEESGVNYNYSIFHLSMVCGALYVMMILTNWIVPGNDLANLWPAVWIKVTTSWLAAILYIWTLVAPIVLNDRSF